MKTIPIKIASPCSARWEDMSGDERRRFCNQCQKHVYNFNELSRDEINGLIREKEGNVCARFYQRPDGTMLLENCPRGVARTWRRFKIMASSALALFLLAGAAFAKKKTSRTPVEVSHGPILQKVDQACSTVKGWVGIEQKRILMGKVALPPVTTNSPVRK